MPKEQAASVMTNGLVPRGKRLTSGVLQIGKTVTTAIITPFSLRSPEPKVNGVVKTWAASWWNFKQALISRLEIDHRTSIPNWHLDCVAFLDGRFRPRRLGL